jgi:hypothetical protein
MWSICLNSGSQERRSTIDLA